MNQEQNNFNSNNLNIEGNNGIPNNQPLQNSHGFNNTSNQTSFNTQIMHQQPINPQPTSNFQQQINQIGNMQSTAQSINSFENENTNNGISNNQSFNNTFNEKIVSNTNDSQIVSNQQTQQSTSFELPIIQEPTSQFMNNVFESGNASNPVFNDKPPKKINFMLIIGLVICVVVIMMIIILFLNNISSSNNKLKEDTIISKASFEKSGEHYILKDENGKILLDNIKHYGNSYVNDFCNGTIKITTTDEEVGIINDKGEFIAEPGKYRFIFQVGCYYEVTNNEDAIKKKILKYDGSVFFEDASDIYLNKSSIECAVDFCFSKKVALFSTNEKYQLLDSRGKIIKEYEKIANVNKPKIQAQKNDEEMDRYITSYYNGKTDVIDTNSNEIIGLLNGDYYVIDVNTNNENQFILYKNDDVNKHTIVFNNGKKTFDTTSCYNVFFQDDEVNCLVGNSIFDYYDINGNKINK